MELAGQASNKEENTKVESLPPIIDKSQDTMDVQGTPIVPPAVNNLDNLPAIK